MAESSLRLAWWNTGLAPRRGQPGGASAKTYSDTVARLRRIGAADVAVLGETTNIDADAMRTAFPEGYQVRLPSDFTAVNDETWGVTVFFAGHVRVEACMVMRASLDAAHHMNRHQWSFRVTLADHDPVDVFVVHWPSRVENDGGLRKRLRLAQILKDRIGESRHTCPHAVVMGDFNDEPFDDTLNRGLVAVRDRATAARLGHLYNPFWSFIGDAHRVPGDPDLLPGTHRWTGGVESPWRTFDQILFSSAFIGDRSWHLPRDGVTVVDSANLGSGEHHPVACRIVAMRGRYGTV